MGINKREFFNRSQSMILEILKGKAAELKAEVMKELCSMPFRQRFIFAIKVLFKKV